MPCTLHHHNGCSSLGACITTKSVPAPPPPLLPGFPGWGGAALTSNPHSRPSSCPSRIQPLNTKALNRKLLQLVVPALYRASPQRLLQPVRHHNGCSSLVPCIATTSVPAPPPPLLPGFAGWVGAAAAVAAGTRQGEPRGVELSTGERWPFSRAPKACARGWAGYRFLQSLRLLRAGDHQRFARRGRTRCGASPDPSERAGPQGCSLGRLSGRE